MQHLSILYPDTVGLNSSTMCQFSKHGEALPNQFESFSCSACLFFIFLFNVNTYQHSYKIRMCPNGLMICPDHIYRTTGECHCGNRKYVYNVPEYSLNRDAITPIKYLHMENPSLPPGFEIHTQECCSAAKSCCEYQIENPSKERCGSTWDGYDCFAASQPGEVHQKTCPSYIYGGLRPDLNDGYHKSQRICLEDGWRGNWTDYQDCTETSAIEIVFSAGVITYTISVVVVLPAVLLLTLMRPIRTQPMFILHRHLLISFLAYGAINVFTAVVYLNLNSDHTTDNILCRFIFSLQLRFLRISNFSWMLAEGVYLYRLLHTAQSDGDNLLIYKLICWGVPATITAIYMMVRGLNDDQSLCWIENSSVLWIEWMIILPSLLAMLVNVLLLTLVMYILVKKLRCDPHLERMQYRKAVRGALLLIPVFGVQQLLTIYRLRNVVYQTIDVSLNGLQGLFVALIVCYTNRSVLECCEKYWNSRREKRALGAECRQRMSIQETGKLLLLKSPDRNELSP
ncbi:unnamed protein product [Caenorhabditis angaria]|uniref:G-protein coupled receptors family 2 profile 2 domain-containing protein n=1 Tax=Caenorhabditis angaria TaxID=860376 RepID=A0A9P1IIQ0_9PELO|nr:unnamed protein product [Caenorhabditis angaria]